jgi:catechol 2,3-dioxygenase-like lactoylglutathione lyase family enzyme
LGDNRDVMVKGLNTILCQVQDMNRACAFYRDVLGLTPGTQTPYWSDFELGAVKLGLHPPFASGYVRPAGGWIVGFEVESLLELRAALAEAGIQAQDFHDVPGGVIMDFADPDGNALEAIQRGTTKAALESA